MTETIVLPAQQVPSWWTEEDEARWRADHSKAEPRHMGALAAALAKAQAAYPTITRDKRVTVQTRTGGSYTFNYAPLDSILEKVRKPLSDNGLAIAQMLDGPDLVTTLLHESGASLSGRVPLPRNDGDTVQQYGSAVTYLRRYALQAMLGIAAEEDDDGNAASGNRATARGEAQADRAAQAFDAGLVGTAEKGTARDSDFELRETPNGYRLGFRLVEGRSGIKTIATGPLAELVAEYRTGIEGQRVTVWGAISDESFQKDEGGKKKTIRYQVLNLTRLKVGVLDLTAPEPDEEEAPATELTAEEEAELAQLAFPVSA